MCQEFDVERRRNICFCTTKGLTCYGLQVFMCPAYAVSNELRSVK